MRTSLKAAVAILVLAAVAGTAFHFVAKPILDQNTERAVSWHAVSWRAQLYLRKASGNLPDLSWVELWEDDAAARRLFFRKHVHLWEQLGGCPCQSIYLGPRILRLANASFVAIAQCVTALMQRDCMHRH